MQVVLQITQGPATGRRIHLRGGQSIQVGRTEKAEFAIPNDLQLSSLHFSLACSENGCQIRDLGSTNGTFLNGQKVTEALLQPGDRVTAGQTEFTTHMDTPGLSANAKPAAASSAAAVPKSTPAATAAAAAVGLNGPAETSSKTAAEICRNVPLEEEAKQLLEEKLTPKEYLAKLTQHELFPDAIRFLAHALPKRAAVWWAYGCVHAVAGEKPAAHDAKALEAAQRWVLDPTEENRRAAVAAAEATGLRTASGWAAMGAFWSEGSVTPPGAPPVPPAEHLTAHAVAGAVMLAAVATEPEKAPEKYHRFLASGTEIADGKQLWPEKVAG